MTPRLSILVATVGRRNNDFVKLMQHITKQAEKWPIEIVAYWNTGELPIGTIRQALLEEAKGEYICFVDDDDWVPDYYCDEIMYAMGKDYIGFQVQLFEKGVEQPRVFHSIKYGIWHEDEEGYKRGITHLNPIRREIALLGKFGDLGIGEDEAWARSLTPHVQTENYINQIMYYYRHNAAETMFGGSVRQKEYYYRLAFEHPQFRYHPNSKLEGVM